MADYLLGSPKNAGIYSYLTNNPISNPYHNKTKYGVEQGIDFAMAMHTPMYALADGFIVGMAFLACPGGVMAIESVIPIHGTPTEKPQRAVIYYQHMDVFAPGLVVNDSVVAGQLIGYSGGQLSGGYHNNQPACSSAAHIEIGINPPYPKPWNPHKLTPQVDPRPFLAAVARGETFDVVYTITAAPGFLPIAQALDDAQRFLPADTGSWITDLGRNTGPAMSRAIFMLIGLMFVFGVLFNLLRPVAEQVASTAGELGADAVKLGALAA